jgi:hypothetical protein
MIMFIAGTKIEVEVDVRGARSYLVGGRNFEPAVVIVTATSDGREAVLVRGWPLKTDGGRYAKPMEFVPSLKFSDVEGYVLEALSLAREFIATAEDPNDFLER